MHLAPSDYDRKQTLVNAERFTTPELKELEAKILEAEDKMLVIERDILKSFGYLHPRSQPGSKRRRRPSPSWT